MSSHFKWKRSRSYSSTSSTDSNSVLSFLDEQVDISDDGCHDGASPSSNNSESERSQPPSQQSSPLLVAQDSPMVDSDGEEDNIIPRTQNAEITAGDKQAMKQIIKIIRDRKWNFTDFLCVYMRYGE